jgi:hypothetical protein
MWKRPTVLTTIAAFEGDMRSTSVITPDDFLDRFASRDYRLCIDCPSQLRVAPHGLQGGVLMRPISLRTNCEAETRKRSIIYVGLATSVGLTQTLEPSGELMNSTGIYVRFS